jgi:hypothetical protein
MSDVGHSPGQRPRARGSKPGEGPLKVDSDDYPGDSNRYSGSEVYPRDLPVGDQAASDDYPGDSGRYPDSPGPTPRSEPGPHPRIEAGPPYSPPPPRRRSRMDPRTGWLREGDFLGDGAPLPEEPMERQVNVRLNAHHYRDLSKAADLYGVAPTTMARMLVRRGTKAVLDERRRDDFLHGGPD